MRPHRALAAALAALALTGLALTTPDAARAVAAPDDTSYAAASGGCLVKGTAASDTLNTTYTVSVAVPSGWQQVAATSGTLRTADDPVTTRVDLTDLFVGTVEVYLKNGDEVWASCKGRFPLGQVGWERRAGNLGHLIEP
ncbi:hypothetical protein [Streptomyces sp. MZ04]|uniref:hypothetical protein n=1 Tax=Streptomyces sp. MZ04 TaxID=2559236 RepID=UPI00107E8138|nr:hypothetical protein [Streptomyces sp. MZ04]TGA97911.1 hypothetical protein E2651_30935 [Streptomyces sp. MZ04]